VLTQLHLDEVQAVLYSPQLIEEPDHICLRSDRSNMDVLTQLHLDEVQVITTDM
jgi:hypothetical protein